MLFSRRTRYALAAATAGTVLAATLTTVHADTTDDLAASFSTFSKTLPGSVQVAITGAGGQETIVLGGKNTAPATTAVRAEPAQQPAPSKTRCATIAHIGDSTSVQLNNSQYIPNKADQLTPQYQRAGARKVVLDATGGRSIVERVGGNPNAAEGVDALLRDGFRGCWVIAMGVNDFANIAVGSNVNAKARIDTIMGKLKGQDVMWPTVHTTAPSNPAYSTDGARKFNAELKSAAARYPNLKVFDFAAQAKASMYSDGIHYTPAAAAARNKMFADALVQLFPAAPSPTRETPDTPDVVTVPVGVDPAWGSIRIPLALAAARAGATPDTVTSTIASSDNTAATTLWKNLEPDPAKKVTEVLSSLGDPDTQVTTRPDQAYEQLATTAWAVPAQSKFGAGLLCAPDRSTVTAAMMQNSADDANRWGLQNASGKNGVQFVATHGGWGPNGQSYSARQLALVQTARGLMSVAISGQGDGDRNQAVDLVNKAAEWLVQNIDAAPAGFCDPSDAATATTAGSDSHDHDHDTEEPRESTDPAPSPTSARPSEAGTDSGDTGGTSEAGADSTATSTVPPSTTPAPTSAGETHEPEPAEPDASREDPEDEAPDEDPKAEEPEQAAPAPKLAGEGACTPTVIALDPGHNGQSVDAFDPVTGAKMVDYPNGAEDADVLSVAQKVKSQLESTGAYKVVLLKTSTGENVSYRDRIKRAEDAGAVVGISIHTAPNDNSIFVQKVGLYREGPGADGSNKRIEFTDAALASKSQTMGGKFAQARSQSEGHKVVVRDNSFDGRAPLWSGNIPIISLISQKVPWIYNEFGGSNGSGGANKIVTSELDQYAAGLVAGVKASAPGRRCG